MLVLRSEDQQKKNPHDTWTVNLALVQCECLTGK